MPIRPFNHPPSPTVFSSLSEVAIYFRRFWESYNQLRKGKTENVGEITLTANAATTTINDSRLSIQSFIGFDPQTANAAAELAAGTMYVLLANRAEGVFTITHANNAQTNRSFFYAIIG
jgi:hypothetical protein